VVDVGAEAEAAADFVVDFVPGGGDAAFAGDDADELFALNAGDGLGDAVLDVVGVKDALGDIREDTAFDEGVVEVLVTDAEDVGAARLYTIGVVAVGDEQEGGADDEADPGDEEDGVAPFGVDVGDVAEDVGEGASEAAQRGKSPLSGIGVIVV
jgi:hypothetical protein